MSPFVWKKNTENHKKPKSGYRIVCLRVEIELTYGILSRTQRRQSMNVSLIRTASFSTHSVPFSLKQITQTVPFVAWLQPSVTCASSEVLIPGQHECEGRPMVVGWGARSVCTVHPAVYVNKPDFKGPLLTPVPPFSLGL